MAYQVYYPGCEDEQVDHYCSECERLEGSRIRSSALIRADYYATAVDLSNPAWWVAGIQQKKIIIIPKTNGNYDGGAEVEGPGFGDQETTLLGYNHTAVFNDPNYQLNGDFWNTIKRSRNWVYVFKTETLIHPSVKTVSIVPKNPVTDATTDRVYWNITIKWASEDSPVPYPEPPGIFDQCIDYTGVIV